MPQSPSTLTRRRRTSRPRTVERPQERSQARTAFLRQEEAPPEVLAEEALEPEPSWAEAYDDEPCEAFESPERPSPERGASPADLNTPVLRYLQEAGRVPLLSAADEVRLGEQIRTAYTQLGTVLLAQRPAASAAAPRGRALAGRAPAPAPALGHPPGTRSGPRGRARERPARGPTPGAVGGA